MEWLDADQISRSIDRLERLVKKSTMFFGPYPIDVFDDLSQLDWDLYKKGDTSFAFIINTSVRSGRGSHWVSVFLPRMRDCYNVDTRTLQIEYFDSMAGKPSEVFGMWWRQIQKQLDRSIYLEILVNKKRMQFGTSECGMFAICYLWFRSKGCTIENIQSWNLTDVEMSEFRQRFIL